MTDTQILHEIILKKLKRMQEIKMSPLMVEMLLFYHYSSSPNLFKPQSQATAELNQILVQAGILQELKTQDHGWQYVADKEALKVYVDAVLQIPLPVRSWRVPVIINEDLP